MKKLPPLPPREKMSDGAPDEVMAQVMRKVLNITPDPDMVYDPRTGAYVLPEYLNDPEINPGCDLDTGLRWRLTGD